MRKKSYRQEEQTVSTRMDNAYTKEEKERKGERRMKRRREEGITLIALVVTIVILIILATISISALFGENGLIKKAQEAKDHQTNAVAMEEGEMDKLAEEYANIMASDGNGGGTVTPPTISPSTSYVGHYANIDDDPEPDGVIYADLAIGGSGQWGDSWGGYSYTQVTSGLKQYYISSESYTGFGGKWTKPVITAVEGSQGADRFYVMALEDFNAGTEYYWYNSASGKLDDPIGASANDFGEGKENTTTMISKWNGTYYGAQNSKDMWGVIQKADNTGKTWDLNRWFVPSKAEWAAFGDFAFKTMEVTTSTYGQFGLSDYYWSSAQRTTDNAYNAHFNSGNMDGSYSVRNPYSVRLSATF